MTLVKNVLRIRVNRPTEQDPYEDFEIRPLIDGVDVIERAFEDSDDGARCGDPRDWLVPGGPLAAGERPYSVEMAEKWCGCHSALYLTVRREGGDTVVWTWKAADGAGPELPEYRFDAAQYDAELRRAGQDSGWERPAQTVARLLRDALLGERGWPERWSCELGNVWTDPKLPGRVLIYFLRDEQEADGTWRRAEEFGAHLEVDEDADPVPQADRLARAFLAGDPRAADGVRACLPGESLSDWLGGYGHYHGEGPLPWKTYL
jgi:hypothetical protein